MSCYTVVKDRTECRLRVWGTAPAAVEALRLRVGELDFWGLLLHFRASGFRAQSSGLLGFRA